MKDARDYQLVVSGIRTLFILSVVSLVGCNGSPTAQSAHDGFADHIQLERVGAEWNAYGQNTTVIKLTNGADRGVSYTGYSSEPVYTLQVQGSILDWWTWHDEGPSGWCGVGLGTRILNPQQSVTFKVPTPDHSQPWRVGIKIKDPDIPNIWTRPIVETVREGRWAAGAEKLVETAVEQHPGRNFPYTFILKNTSASPIFYGGFQEPNIPPIYLNQEMHSGNWEDSGQGDWSGTGFGFKELVPGASISFPIPGQSLDAMWRIGIRLFMTARPESPDDIYKPIWWPPFPPRKPNESDFNR
jgi:hypothetical protein